jgi:hypothetical protein
VKQPDRRSPGRAAKHAPHAPRTPFAVLVVALIVGGMATLLALNTAAAANEVHRSDIAGKDQGIAARLVQLHNQLQASAAPSNLAAAAAALGMVPGGNPGFLEIGSDGTVRILGSASPATAAPVHLAQPQKQKKTKKKVKPTTTSTSTSTATSTATATATATATSTATSTATAAKTAGQTTTSSATKTAPVRPTSPTPTPTPNTTLPGGTR